MRRAGRAFTLIEAVMTTVVLSVLAAVTLPLIQSATDSYAATSAASRVADDLGFALDRVVRVLREAPPGSDEGTIGVARAASDEVLFSDGSGCRLTGRTLSLLKAEGTEGPIATDIDELNLRYIAADGTSAAGNPSLTQRFEVGIASGGLELRAVAFCRARYGS